MASNKPQVNVSLTREEFETLQAIAYLRGSSAAEVLRPLVAEYLDDEGQRDRVRLLMRLRAEEQAEQEGKLRPLRSPAATDRR